eukprot:764736-Hanusia_phi.AAC.3
MEISYLFEMSGSFARAHTSHWYSGGPRASARIRTRKMRSRRRRRRRKKKRNKKRKEKGEGRLTGVYEIDHDVALARLHRVVPEGNLCESLAREDVSS